MRTLKLNTAGLQNSFHKPASSVRSYDIARSLRNGFGIDSRVRSPEKTLPANLCLPKRAISPSKLRKYREHSEVRSLCRYPMNCVAGAGGIEPPNAGIKIRCLTAWRRPNLRIQGRPKASPPNKYASTQRAYSCFGRSEQPPCADCWEC